MSGVPWDGRVTDQMVFADVSTAPDPTELFRLRAEILGLRQTCQVLREQRDHARDMACALEADLARALELLAWERDRR